MSNHWPQLEGCPRNKIGKEQMATLISRKRSNHLQRSMEDEVRRLDVASRDGTVRLGAEGATKSSYPGRRLG